MANNDSSGTNGTMISYPTSVESFGRGIDLTHGGMMMQYFLQVRPSFSQFYTLQ